MARVCSVPDCGKPHRARGYCIAHYGRLVRNGDPLSGRTTEGEPLRFVHEVAMLHTSGECLIWPFGKAKGYGNIWVDGRTTIASRYVCELVHGAPPTPEHEAAHSCGKGDEGCIAPKHLSWKTPAQNQADRLEHGTHNRGERHNMVKLSEDEVREIIDLKGVEPKNKLAKRFGVSPQTVSKIHCGKTWAWLEGRAND